MNNEFPNWVTEVLRDLADYLQDNGHSESSAIIGDTIMLMKPNNKFCDWNTFLEAQNLSTPAIHKESEDSNVIFVSFQNRTKQQEIMHHING